MKTSTKIISNMVYWVGMRVYTSPRGMIVKFHITLGEGKDEVAKDLVMYADFEMASRILWDAVMDGEIYPLATNLNEDLLNQDSTKLMFTSKIKYCKHLQLHQSEISCSEGKLWWCNANDHVDDKVSAISLLLANSVKYLKKYHP